MAALGSACGGDDDDEQGGSASPAAGGATGTAKPIPSEMVIANEAEPDDLLPYFAGFGPGLVMRSIYETLVEVRMGLNPDGSASVAYVPVLAESYKQTSPTTFEFKLRPNVKFHDGEAWN